MSDNREITLPKQEQPLSYLISLFHILREEASDKDWVQEGNQIKWIPKEPNNIQLNYDDLRVKILNWMSDRANNSPLNLNSEESDLLRKCSHAAYYFITEDSYPPEKRSEKFVAFHEYYFR